MRQPREPLSVSRTHAGATSATTPHDTRQQLMALHKAMKGPLANILAMSQTLAMGRIARPAIREYARMTTAEAGRLALLLDQAAAVTRASARRPALPHR
ncbi:MAG: hypothetical protein U0Q55_04485 [Vicinamibacterales bacterium]